MFSRLIALLGFPDELDRMAVDVKKRKLGPALYETSRLRSLWPMSMCISAYVLNPPCSKRLKAKSRLISGAANHCQRVHDTTIWSELPHLIHAEEKMKPGEKMGWNHGVVIREKIMTNFYRSRKVQLNHRTTSKIITLR